MKNAIITTVLSLFILSASAQSYSKTELNTIQTFLGQFQEAAKSQDKEKLLTLIQPLEIENQNISDLIAEKAMKGDEKDNTAFAYSDKSMTIISQDYINQFEPISEELKNMLYQNDEFHKVISKKTNQQVAMLDHEGAKVIIVLDGDNTKLLFWDKLNSLLK
jgi:hypothetical protein